MRSLPLILVLLVAIGGAAFLIFSGGVDADLSSQPEIAPLTPGGSGSSTKVTDDTELATLDPDATAEAERAAGAVTARPALRLRSEAEEMEEPEGEPIVLGRVVDDLGVPVKDARVTLYVVPTGLNQMPTMMMSGVEETMRRRGKKKKVDTEEDGKFDLKIPTLNRELDLVVEAPGFEKKTLKLGMPVKLPIELDDVQLVQGCIIKGIVVDEHGNPLRRASISLAHPDNDEEDVMGLEALGIRMNSGPRTGKDGTFEYPHASAGRYEMRIDHKERPETKREGETRVGEVLELKIELPDGGKIAGHLEGMPKDATGVIVQARYAPELDTQNPDASGEEEEEGMMEVMFGEMGMSTGEHWTKVEKDGSFLLEGLELRGGYMVWVAEPHRQFFMREAISPEYEAWVGEQDLRIPYEDGVSVQMQVVDASSKSAIREFTVSSQMSGNDWPARRDEVNDRDGKTALTKIRPKGEGKVLHIAVRATGYKIYRDQIVVPEKGELLLGQVLMQPQPVLRVVTKVGRNEKPLADVHVVLNVGEDLPPEWAMTPNAPAMMSQEKLDEDDGGDRRPRRGTTDAEGVCEMNSFPGEAAVLILKAEGYATRRVDLSLPLSGDHEEVVLMSAGGSAILQVVDAEGFAAPRARVEQLRPWATEESLRGWSTDERGVVTLTGLTPGSHSFRARQEKRRNMGFRPDNDEKGGRGEWVEIPVVEGEVVEVTVVLPLFGTLTGRVTEAGEPLAGASLSLLKINDERRNRRVVIEGMERFMAVSNDTSSEKGLYELQNVAAGKYELKVRHPDRAMPTTIEIEVEEGEHEHDIELSANMIEGRVTRDDGQPIEGASITAIPAAEAGRARLGLGFLFGGNSGSSASARTDANGHYQLRGLTAGEAVVVRAQAKQHSPDTSEEVILAAGERQSGIDLVLTRSGALTVHVRGSRPFQGVRAYRLDEQGQPVAAADGSLEADGDPTPQRVVLTRKGTAKFDDLEPGNWRIEVDDAEDQTIELEAGVPLSLTFESGSD
ncbi:MAG: protocatechuate 3,4-dioxygenase beta subunit [Planctomycetota bacterium]|jgi:protocatechuate 3,4-dioxygenase beta subunit